MTTTTNISITNNNNSKQSRKTKNNNKKRKQQRSALPLVILMLAVLLVCMQLFTNDYKSLSVSNTIISSTTYSYDTLFATTNATTTNYTTATTQQFVDGIYDSVVAAVGGGSTAGIINNHNNSSKTTTTTTKNTKKDEENDDDDKTLVIPRYYQIEKLVANQKDLHPGDHKTSFSQATVYYNKTSSLKPEFIPKEFCTTGCCAKSVAISYSKQDSTNIINTVDGLDLSDINLQHYKNPPSQKFFAHTFNEQWLPCLQNGTIIHIDNHISNLEYWFNKIRPQMNTTYILITSESDAQSPQGGITYEKMLDTDPLLLKWYGTNPKLIHPKFVPMPLGLRKFSGQENYLSTFLNLTSYKNPFASKQNKQKYITLLENINDDELFYNEIFVKFSLHKFPHQKVPPRKAVYDMFCNNNTSNSTTNYNSSNNVIAQIHNDTSFLSYRTHNNMSISCTNNRVSEHLVYAAASTYLFGLSPPGVGWDCYRTYEMLLLGIIPIIDSSSLSYEASIELFKDLPVIHMTKDMRRPKAFKDDYVNAIRTFINSTDFINNNYENGWNRLFLKYWRERLLKDSGRRYFNDNNNMLVVDKEGNTYYQGWQYTPFNDDEPKLCHKDENCKAPPK